MNQSEQKGISKTMFCVEGNPNMMMVIETPSGPRPEAYWFPHPETALAWCIRHACNFVYSRAQLDSN